MMDDKKMKRIQLAYKIVDTCDLIDDLMDEFDSEGGSYPAFAISETLWEYVNKIRNVFRSHLEIEAFRSGSKFEDWEQWRQNQ